MLLEVGVTIARSGRRETLLERRERDQGQHDGTRQVLAVGTAGLLVRRDVWDELGGLDPRLPLLRDDVDLGWRATLAGHRVLCVTDAVVLHAEAASRRRRAVHVGHRLHRLDRQHATYVLLANLPLLLLPVALLSLTLGSLLRSLGYLAGKLPRHAADELGGLLAVLLRPGRLIGARRRRRRTRRVPSRTALPLLAPRSAGLRHLMETAALVAGTSTGDVAGGRHRGRRRSGAAGTAAPATGPTSEEDEDLPSWGTSLLRRLVLRPSVGVVVVAVLVTLLAARGLLGEGRLMGGALLPAPDTAADLWRSYVTAWHPVGIGSDAIAPPYLAVLAALATVLGSPERAVDLVLLGAVPLAAATGYLAARRLVGSVPVRVWAAATYALLPPTLGAIAAGRLGTAVLAVLLPLVGLAVTRALALDTTGGRRRARRTGPRDGGGGPAARRRHRLRAPRRRARPGLRAGGAAGGARLRAAPAGRLVLAPLVLLLPWLPALVADPQLLLLEAGLPGPGLSDAAPDADHRAAPAGRRARCRAAPADRPPPAGRAGRAAAAGRPATGGHRLAARPDRLRRRPGPGPAGGHRADPGDRGAGLARARPAAGRCRPGRGRRRGRRGRARPGRGQQLRLAAAHRRGPRSPGRRAAARPGRLVGGCRRRRPAGPAGPGAAAGVRGGGGRRAVPAAHPGAAAPRRPATWPTPCCAPRGRAPATPRWRPGPTRRGTRSTSWWPTWPPAAAATPPPGWSPTASATSCSPGRPTPALARAIDAVPGMVRVSGASGTVLWKVDYPTGRLRLLAAGAPVVDSEGSPPAAQVLPAGQVRARTDLPAGRAGPAAGPRRPARTTAGAPVSTGRSWHPAATTGGRRPSRCRPRVVGLEVRHEQGLRTVLLWVQLVATVAVVVLALPKVRTHEDDDLVDDDDVDAPEVTS